jgi:4-cresol dehydrogenase (hydroxylating)
MESRRFDEAVQTFTSILGSQGVDVSQATLDRYSRSTGFSSIRPQAVIYPKSTEQVQDVVRAAGRFHVSVYPISRGHNWGYGDACPPTESQFVIDLSQMNRIVEVNTRLSYAVIEAGVTQGQLFRYFQEHDIPLWMDCTGAGSQASIVGNALERGFGHTCYGDHVANICGMKIVLPNGRVLETGMGRYSPSNSRYVYPHGVGPSLDGLFVQSNLGIVTQIGLWLMPRPDAYSAFFIRTDDASSLEPLIERLSAMRQRGLIRSTVHIANDLRVLSARIGYPWERANNRTPLPADLRNDLRQEHRLGAWNAAGAIYGDRRTVKAARKSIKLGMRPFAVRFVNERRMKFAAFVSRALGFTSAGRGLADLLESMRPNYELLQGRPTDAPLKGATWRVRQERPRHPSDPRDVHAGVAYVSPVLPATGDAAKEAVDIISPIYDRYGFDALITFTMINERALICVTNVAFDVRSGDDIDDAAKCYREMSEALLSAGHVPYRTGPDGFEMIRDDSSTFWQVVRSIKLALDPGRIISPGRYARSD